MTSDAAINADDMQNVRRGVAELRPLLDRPAVPPQDFVIEANGGRVRVDPEILRSMVKVLEAVASENSADEVTPQEAATLLGMSRPSVMRLIGRGILRARMVNTHHRLSRSEVLAYRTAQAGTRRDALVNLTRLSEEYDF